MGNKWSELCACIRHGTGMAIMKPRYRHGYDGHHPWLVHTQIYSSLCVIVRTLCKKGCYTVLYNACIHVLCTRYTRVIRMCITLRMDTLYTVAYNN